MGTGGAADEAGRECGGGLVEPRAPRRRHELLAGEPHPRQFLAPAREGQADRSLVESDAIVANSADSSIRRQHEEGARGNRVARARHDDGDFRREQVPSAMLDCGELTSRDRSIRE